MKQKKLQRLQKSPLYEFSCKISGSSHQKKELMKAIEDGNRSFEEIMQSLQGDASAESSEDVES